MKEKKFFRQCPQCGKTIGYGSKDSRDSAESRGSLCMSCSKRGKYTGENHPMFNKHHTDETRAKMAAAHTGKNNPMYKADADRSDITRLIYWSKDVMDRDRNQCQHSRFGPCKGRLEAHHIFPKETFPEQTLNVHNGVTLCVKHHKAEHKILRAIEQMYLQFNNSAEVQLV